MAPRRVDYDQHGVSYARYRRADPRLEAHGPVVVSTFEIDALPPWQLDGFFEAFWNRPEMLLDPAVRASLRLVISEPS